MECGWDDRGDGGLPRRFARPGTAFSRGFATHLSGDVTRLSVGDLGIAMASSSSEPASILAPGPPLVLGEQAHSPPDWEAVSGASAERVAGFTVTFKSKRVMGGRWRRRSAQPWRAGGAKGGPGVEKGGGASGARTHVSENNAESIKILDLIITC